MVRGMTEEDVQRGIQDAFSLARDVIDEPEAYPDRFVSFTLANDAVLELLTKDRLGLLRTVRDEGPFETITRLADTLDRDPSRVSRDLTWLQEVGLVRIEKHGRSKTVESTGRKILIA